MSPRTPLTFAARRLRFAAAAVLACSASLVACSSGEPPADQAAPADDRTVVYPHPSVDEQSGKGANTPEAVPKNYQTIEWTDLIPEDDLEALLSPPEYLDEIEDGSEADQLESQTQSLTSAESDDRYQQALASRRIIAEYDNSDIRLPGFIVPLEFDDDMTVTEFFLVPYFGACIHLPPPPPNQIIHVVFNAGLQVEELADPFWITGTLKTRIVENDVATAAYTMQAVKIEPYDEYVDLPEE